jgi:hypothetical protein
LRGQWKNLVGSSDIVPGDLSETHAILLFAG